MVSTVPAVASRHQSHQGAVTTVTRCPLADREVLVDTEDFKTFFRISPEIRKSFFSSPTQRARCKSPRAF